MPTYSYECASCGHVTDMYHSMSAKPRVKCSACGGRTKRLLGMGAGIIFKGSGFYETDYKRSGGGEGKSESKGESKSEAKGETKTETKSDSSSSKGKGDSKPAGKSSSAA